jgi:carbon storage regulator
MLVLSRKLNQAIMIGDDVRITIVEIRDDQVRLGISAPREVPVYREEVFDKIKSENEAANRVGIEDVTRYQQDTSTKRRRSAGSSSQDSHPS